MLGVNKYLTIFKTYTMTDIKNNVFCGTKYNMRLHVNKSNELFIVNVYLENNHGKTHVLKKPLTIDEDVTYFINNIDKTHDIKVVGNDKYVLLTKEESRKRDELIEKMNDLYDKIMKKV
jgi:hypothetical protein